MPRRPGAAHAAIPLSDLARRGLHGTRAGLGAILAAALAACGASRAVDGAPGGTPVARELAPPRERPAIPAPQASRESASGPASAQATGSRPEAERLVARAAGEAITVGQAFEALLFHHRDVTLEVIRKLAGDAILRAEARRLGVVVRAEDVDAGVRQAFEHLRERLELEYGPEMSLDRFFAEDLQTSSGEYAARLRSFVETSRLAALLVRYDEICNERVVVREIAVRDRAAAQAVLQRARDGADFAVLARNESIAPSRRDGGRLPPFDRELEHPLVEPAFATPVGEIGGPIEDARGGVAVFRIFRVLERIPGRDAPFAAHEDEIRSGLQDLPIDRTEYETYMRKQGRRYDVEILPQR